MLVDEPKFEAASKVGGDGAVAQVSFSPSTFYSIIVDVYELIVCPTAFLLLNYIAVRLLNSQHLGKDELLICLRRRLFRVKAETLLCCVLSVFQLVMIYAGPSPVDLMWPIGSLFLVTTLA